MASLTPAAVGATGVSFDSDDDSDFGSPLFGDIADKKALKKLAVMTLSSPKSCSTVDDICASRSRPQLSIQIDEKENVSSSKKREKTVLKTPSVAAFKAIFNRKNNAAGRMESLDSPLFDMGTPLMESEKNTVGGSNKNADGKHTRTSSLENFKALFSDNRPLSTTSNDSANDGSSPLFPFMNEHNNDATPKSGQ